jgi:MoaA/NifB/PqqE/SkfB family radical SAM enzyme
MDAGIIFSERNREFFNRAARVAFGAALASGNPAAALAAAARYAAVAKFQGDQARKRSAAALRGRTVPGILIASVTRRCNLNCAGCYSKTLRPDASGELSDKRFLELFQEAADLGVGTLMIAGGEPLMRRSLLEGAARIPGIVVPVFTNGSLVDGPYLDLFSSGRVVPIFSVEGDAAFTAGRRGDGIHENVLRHAAELKKRGAVFGFSVTLTSRNADSVLSDRFLREVEKLGASALFLIEFVPVESGSEGLVLTDAQKADLSRPKRFDAYRFLTVSLPGDEEAFGGCLAAGRGFIHLSDDGSLEACPFAPFSDASAARTSLAEALESPLMRAIRERHGELTETKGGCALWNKRGWVASLGACAARNPETPVPA